MDFKWPKSAVFELMLESSILIGQQINLPMFPSILIRTGVFRDRFAVNAILYVSQICLKKKILNSKAKNPMKILWNFF